MAELCERFGARRATVLKRLREAGAEIRPGGTRYLDLRDKDRLLTLYRECGYDTVLIASALKCDRGSLYPNLRRLGIPTALRRRKRG